MYIDHRPASTSINFYLTQQISNFMHNFVNMPTTNKQYTLKWVNYMVYKLHINKVIIKILVCAQSNRIQVLEYQSKVRIFIC